MIGLVAAALITGITLLERRSKAVQKPVEAEPTPEEATEPPVEAERPIPPPEYLKALVHYPVSPQQLMRAEQSEKLTLLRYNLRRGKGNSG